MYHRANSGPGMVTRFRDGSRQIDGGPTTRRCASVPNASNDLAPCSSLHPSPHSHCAWHVPARTTPSTASGAAPGGRRTGTRRTRTWWSCDDAPCCCCCRHRRRARTTSPTGSCAGPAGIRGRPTFRRERPAPRTRQGAASPCRRWRTRCACAKGHERCPHCCCVVVRSQQRSLDFLLLRS
jgi:hypothetical protein